MRLKKDDSIGIVYLLKRAELAVRACAEAALAQFELTPAQFLTLFRLKQSEGISSAELARDVGVRPQSIVDVIGPLERAGLIKRREAAEHRRILRITLTPAGEQLLARAIPLARQLEKELLATFTEPQVAHLREGLTNLLANAQAHETNPLATRAAATAAAREERALSARKAAPAKRPRRPVSAQ